MKVDIWSDIRCPFCYIGKRKFEMALEGFPQRQQIEVEWHSFELDPNLKTEHGKSVYDYLAERKRMTREQSETMHVQVTQMAAEVGLNYDFDSAVISNSFDAHRIIQLAKTKGLGDVSEEEFFKAYFCEGVDISNHASLLLIGQRIGLEEVDISRVLSSNEFADEVRYDEHQAQEIGVTGVPFFVLNNKYAVSGAQAPETFLHALEVAWSEITPTNTQLNDGASCDADGNC